MKSTLKKAIYILLFVSVNSYAGIVYPKPPERSNQVIIANIDTSKLYVSKLTDANISKPLRWYGGVGVSDVASGRLLSVHDWHLPTWIYILTDGTKVVGVTALYEAAGSDSLTYYNFPFVHKFGANLQKALNVAEKLPQLKDRDYEVRYFELESLYSWSFSAIWLHNKSDDILIPLPPTFKGFNAYQPYSQKQVISILEPAAKQELQDLKSKVRFSDWN